MAYTERHGLAVVEYAAQARLASYRGPKSGTFGALRSAPTRQECCLGRRWRAYDPTRVKRAMIIRKNGKSLSELLNGQVDTYTWMDVEPSCLSSGMIAAMPLGQRDSAQNLIERRLSIWNTDAGFMASLEQLGILDLRGVPDNCAHDGRIYHLLAETHVKQRGLRIWLKPHDIDTATH